MSKAVQIEHATQNCIVQLFQQQLRYRYTGNLKGEDHSSNLGADLKAFLAKLVLVDFR
jgi:hypothetical protein